MIKWKSSPKLLYGMQAIELARPSRSNDNDAPRDHTIYGTRGFIYDFSGVYGSEAKPVVVMRVGEDEILYHIDIKELKKWLNRINYQPNQLSQVAIATNWSKGI